MERSSNISPSTIKSSPPPKKKIHLHNSQQSKLCVINGQIHSLQPFPPRTVRDQIILQDIVIRSFDYAKKNGNLKILIRRLWNKKGVAGASCPPIFFVTLKLHKNFIFIRGSVISSARFGMSKSTCLRNFCPPPWPTDLRRHNSYFVFLSSSLKIQWWLRSLII